jgi:hypothetical protein
MESNNSFHVALSVFSFPSVESLVWQSEMYGEHHRISTDFKEKAIADHIADNYLIYGRLFAEAIFVEIATTADLETHQHTDHTLSSGVHRS